MKNEKMYFAVTENGIFRGSAEEVRREVATAKNVRYIHKIKGGLPETVNAHDFINPQEHENWLHCKRISDELDKYVSGNVARCPYCGEEHDISAAVGKYKCPDCGEVAEVDDWDECGIYDYLDDILDIDFTINSRKEYKACRILVAYGGPNIYIDTLSGAVELYWWTDRTKYYLDGDTINAIDEWAEEYYNCI